VSTPIYIMRLDGDDSIYHVRGGEWFSSFRTGINWIPTPKITRTKTGTDVGFVKLKIENGTGVDLDEITDPILAKVAGALVDMAFEMFKHKASGSTVKTSVGRVVKKVQFGEIVPPQKWKVFVCLEWPTWEREGTPWKDRAEQVEKECGDKKSANALQQDCKRMGLC